VTYCLTIAIEARYLHTIYRSTGSFLHKRITIPAYGFPHSCAKVRHSCRIDACDLRTAPAYIGSSCESTVQLYFEEVRRARRRLESCRQVTGRCVAGSLNRF